MPTSASLPALALALALVAGVSASPATPAPVVDVNEVISSLLRMFYIVDPYATSFKTLDEVPNYVLKAQPIFIVFLLLEMAVLLALNLAKSKNAPKLPRLNDFVGSVGAGIIQQMVHLIVGDFELAAYIWVYSNCALFHFSPQQDLYVWILAFLGVDFGYYWAHRGAHELNIGWGSHVTHHNSQDYNLSTALRQSLTQGFFTWVFYMPLAVCGVPPPFFAVHGMLNLIFQFWIHTEAVPSLGYLEYIINTPSSHRVHHGRNPYCIDKNYAGVLIIWDIMFGTYQSEKTDEVVLYGITHNINTFDPIKIQLHQHLAIAKNVWNSKNIKDAVNRVFMGPGWSPDHMPHLRLGDPAGIPRVPNLIKTPDADIGYYNPEILGMQKGNTAGNGLATIYILTNFALTILLQMYAQTHISKLPLLAVILSTAFCVLTLWNLGMMFDGKDAVKVTETVRLVVLWPLFVYYLGQAGLEELLGDVATQGLMVAVPAALCGVFWTTVFVGGARSAESAASEKKSVKEE
ncbi:hypothetical protein HDU80_008399 [Chytriomyces hyalinus]|nr:hypothetical protein HDU80_008399 [Chytriomyces hyalinus]